ncbi:MAG: putative quinol monooxygenase [Ilumatobacteraceae bacterium]
MIVISATLKIDPARTADFAAAATAMTAATLEEPGCASYRFAIACDDPSISIVMEEWQDQEALDLHFATPHMAAFREAVAGIMLGGSSAIKYEVSSKGPLF